MKSTPSPFDIVAIRATLEAAGGKNSTIIWTATFLVTGFAYGFLIR